MKAQSGGRRAELIFQVLNTVTGGKLRATRRNSGGRRVILKALLLFEKGVLPFEKGVLLFEKGVLLFEKGVSLFEKGVLAI